jgi:NAD-dependent dihydropyrimidine dehydrogenase PreA subunit
MSVTRLDLDACVGCEACVGICPMDVFRFDEENRKSVIAYPENCQCCGQCYMYCTARSLTITNDMYGYATASHRGITTVPLSTETRRSSEL